MILDLYFSTPQLLCADPGATDLGALYIDSGPRTGSWPPAAWSSSA